MAWERKLMRTVRVQNDQVVGTLAHLITAIAEQGGNIGEIHLIKEGHRSLVREITIYAEDEAQLERILAAIEAIPNTNILAVKDEVPDLHEKGKITVRSRYVIDSLATLRRVYTIGVAEVCHKIAADPSLARLYTSTSHLVATSPTRCTWPPRRPSPI
jgi:malate dehydrogenase (oxaloacetate-decarboxylating)